MDRDQANFDDVFRDGYRAVVRVVAPIVGSVADAEAVAQEAFLKAYVRWRTVGRYDRPGAWIRRVAIRDGVRFAGRRRRRPDGLPPPGPDPAPGVARRLDIDRALLRLPPKQRACVVLHYLADVPVAEVAASLGCREATVRVHLHRARAVLAEHLVDPVDTSTDTAFDTVIDTAIDTTIDTPIDPEENRCAR